MSTITVRDLAAKHIGQKVRLSLLNGQVVHTGTLTSVAHYTRDTYVGIEYDTGARWRTSDLPWKQREEFTPETPIQIVEEFDL